jgi:glucose-1-phosphate cytidylyltransferase
MLWHVMQIYANFGHKDFYVALGYKAEKIKEYFLNYRAVNSDFTIDLGTGNLQSHQVGDVDWRVTLVNTGENSMTGGRVKRMQKFIGNEPCMLTYGDGLANIDIDSLLKFHKSHGKMVTVTAVRPGARFGELEITGDQVASFQEKPQMGQGWINGGYFVLNRKVLDLIEGDSTVFEDQPLKTLSALGELAVYRHEGFWQCMDTYRELELLNNLYNSDRALWKVW